MNAERTRRALRELAGITTGEMSTEQKELVRKQQRALLRVLEGITAEARAGTVMSFEFEVTTPPGAPDFIDGQAVNTQSQDYYLTLSAYIVRPRP